MCPIYEYQCDECENVQEEIHPMAGPDRKLTCQKCNSKKLTKQLTTPACFLWAHKVPIDPGQQDMREYMDE